MDQEVRAGVRGAGRLDVRRADAGVDVALAVPDVHAPAELLLDVGAEPHVGAEQDLGVGAVGLVDVAHDLDGVGRGAAVVGQRLDLGGRVDVHHDDPLRVAAPASRRAAPASIEAASEQPASRSGIRTVFSGQRIEAVSAMKCTPQKTIVSPLGRRRLAGEPERVADVVGHVLDLGHLVVVGEDHRAALGGQRAHLAPCSSAISCGERTRGAGLGGSHGQVHGSVSSVRERSRAGAECVSAPIEIHSTPVSRDRPERLRGVTPPLASSSARPRHLGDRGAQLLRVHVVQQQPRRAGRERLLDLLGVAHLDLQRRRELRRGAARARDRRARCRPAAAMWFSLIRIAS